MIRSGHIDTFSRDSLPPENLWPILEDPDHRISYPDRLNAAVELLERSCRRLAESGSENKIALYGAEGSMSYKEFDRYVKQIANYFEDIGVKPGNRILLRGPNNISVVALWFAALRVGAVVVTTINLQRASEIEKIVEIGKIQFAAVDHRYLEEWNAVAGFSGSLLIYGGDESFLQKVTSYPGEHRPCDTGADDVALLAFTSGSTGQPKSTIHFHRDLLAIADTFGREIVQADASDIFSGTPPIAFTFGLGGLVIFPFRVGASTVLLEATPPAQLPDAIEKYQITALFTAPTAYRVMLAALIKDNSLSKIKSLKKCISAGEHLPKSTWESFYQGTGIKLIDGIGATEMLHIFISASGDEIIPGMTGRVIKGYRAKVVDENFNEVADGEIGRLAVYGITGCRYLSDERQKVYVNNGWNLTGDLYIRHSNGYFQYQSRSDDMIISSGYNIAAPEVENAILTHPSVSEVAVVGQPDGDRGTIVASFIVLKEGLEGSDLLVKEIQDHVKKKISPYKYPRKVEFVPSLPKTTTGKLQRFRLKN